MLGGVMCSVGGTWEELLEDRIDFVKWRAFVCGDVLV